MTQSARNIKLQGRGIAPGLAAGPAFVFQKALRHHFGVYSIGKRQLKREFKRIDTAIDKVIGDLSLAAERVEQALGPELASIFHSHKLMLRSKSLLDDCRREMEARCVNAEQVVKDVFQARERWFRALDDETLNQRADDIVDLGQRLLRALAGIDTHVLQTLPPGRVLVAERLLPSDTVFLSRRSAVAVVVQYGGPACHAALLAKEMGIPTVAQLPDELFQLVAAGDNMLVDGFAGSVLVKPDSRTQSQFQRRIGYHRGVAFKAREACHTPALTRDGVAIEVMANIGCRDDTELAVENGADGIGLYRIETLYLSCKALPSEDELLDAMCTTLAPARGMPMTIRLLDVGGDKNPGALNLPVEDNPFLGRRGVRLLFAYPDLLYTQLRALLRLSREHDIRILIPMVTLADEVKQLRHMLARETTRLGLTTMPPVGAMIETPAAALCVSDIARYADFLSIGTNDLTQYTMAAGRENPLVSDYFLDSHPAVLRLVGIALENAGEVPVSLCGELASHQQALPKMLAMGLRSLSVSPLQVAIIKEVLRDCSLAARPSPLRVSRGVPREGRAR